MKTITDEIHILPGVLGSCLISSADELLQENLPLGFSTAMALDVANSVNRMVQMAQVKGMKPRTISISYNKFVILTLTINPTAMLIILCTPACNTPLITTTALMLAPEIAKSLDQPPTPEEKATPTSPPEKKENQQTPITPETAQAMEAIKQALFETVGPVADIIFDDCFSKWTTGQQGSLARILEFVGHISGEMDDPPLFQEFKAKISHFL